MTESRKKFQLVPEEFAYLKQIFSHDELRDFLPRLQELVPSGKVSIQLNRAEAERIRDYLTNELAALGFDEDYHPNQTGRMIEELIDRFYIP
jgi:hypothetical protein